MSFVVDNSVALAWRFEDEQNDATWALLDRAAETGALAPQLRPLAALNGLLGAERRGRLSAGVRRRLASLLSDLPITIDDETAGRVWVATAQLAERYRHAAYLELAACLGLPLATADRALTDAARDAGVELLPAR